MNKAYGVTGMIKVINNCMIGVNTADNLSRKFCSFNSVTLLFMRNIIFFC